MNPFRRRSFGRRFLHEFNRASRDPLGAVVGAWCAIFVVKAVGEAAEGVVRAGGDAVARVVASAKDLPTRPA